MFSRLRFSRFLSSCPRSVLVDVSGGAKKLNMRALLVSRNRTILETIRLE